MGTLHEAEASRSSYATLQFTPADKPGGLVVRDRVTNLRRLWLRALWRERGAGLERVETREQVALPRFASRALLRQLRSQLLLVRTSPRDTFPVQAGAKEASA